MGRFYVMIATDYTWAYYYMSYKMMLFPPIFTIQLHYYQARPRLLRLYYLDMPDLMMPSYNYDYHLVNRHKLMINDIISDNYIDS